MAGSDLSRGMLIRINNDLHEVIEFGEHHSGKQKSKTHVTLRNVHNGHITDRRVDDLGPIEEVEHEIRNMQYLYSTGEDYTFMDDETFEQYTLLGEQLGKAVRFLVENDSYRVFCADSAPLSLKLPDTVALAVADTAPPSHSSSGSSNVTKEAVLSSGITVHVPLFIKTGDRIRIDTHSEKYQGKEA
jgi:elongation factor P